MSNFFSRVKTKRLNNFSIYVLGCKVLDALEIIHNAGYVYNDLSLDKILVGHNQTVTCDQTNNNTANSFERITFHLVDFSHLSKYTNRSTGGHLKQEKVKT